MTTLNNDRSRLARGGLRVEQANETKTIVAPSADPAQASRFSLQAAGRPFGLPEGASMESASDVRASDARASWGANAGTPPTISTPTNRKRVPTAAHRALLGMPTAKLVKTRARQSA